MFLYKYYLRKPHCFKVFLILDEMSHVHVFCTGHDDKFVEMEKGSDCFPELSFNFDDLFICDNMRPVALWVDVCYVPSDPNRRLSVVAWEDGSLQVMHKRDTETEISKWSRMFQAGIVRSEKRHPSVFGCVQRNDLF